MISNTYSYGKWVLIRHLLVSSAFFRFKNVFNKISLIRTHSIDASKSIYLAQIIAGPFIAILSSYWWRKLNIFKIDSILVVKKRSNKKYQK